MTTRRKSAPIARKGATAAVDPLIGATIAGRYTIERLIARGGIGLVYLASRIAPPGGSMSAAERDVVIKVLAPNWLDNTETVARFEREGQRLGSVEHANIVRLYECGHELGVAYIVMEHLVGELLSDYLARKGRLTVEEFVPIAAQILKGLGFAHSRGLMHRDIKPANIMLCVRKGRANFVKILDFGMAKLIDGELEITAQHVIGTANYLSPEQIKGDPVDLRCDVYAVGVLFYSMLAGRLPFVAETNAALLYSHVHDTPPPLASLLPDGHGVPAGVIDLITQCLEKDPDARPADADALVEALIDCVPAGLFKLPVADGSTGVFVSQAGMTMPSPSDSLRPELSNAELVRPEAPAPRSHRPTTRNRIRPPIRPATLPPGVPIAGIDSNSTIITLEAAAVASSRGNWGLVIGAMAALLIGGVIMALSFGGSQDKPASPVAAPGVASTAPDRAHLVSVVDQAEADVLSGEFDRARASLDAVASDLDAHPQLKTRAQRVRDRIAVARTLASAQRLEKDGNRDAALRAYREILALDPGHVDARTAIARLETAAGKATTPGEDPAGKSTRPRPTGKKPGVATPATPATSEPANPAPTTPPPPTVKDDPFLPVAKPDDGGVFLPVGGTK